MMTEEDAKKCWCPFTRVLWQFWAVSDGTVATSYNRSPNLADGPPVTLPIEANCIASQCMAWRVDRMNADGRGFCGLAGKPE